MMDLRGWLPLLTDEEVERAMVDEDAPFGDIKLGNDVVGGGRNFSVTVMRAYNVAKKIYKGQEPDTIIRQPDSIFQKSDGGSGRGCIYRQSGDR